MVDFHFLNTRTESGQEFHPELRFYAKYFPNKPCKVEFLVAKQVIFLVFCWVNESI